MGRNNPMATKRGCVPDCGRSPSGIRGGAGARRTPSPSPKAWWSIPNARTDCGKTNGCNVRRRPASGCAWATVRPNGAWRRARPIPCGRWTTRTAAPVDGRQLRFLNVIDEFTREALATRPRRSWNADQTTGLLDELIMTTGRRPEHIRMDNGPELTSHALADWARFGSVGCVFIQPGAPLLTG